MKRNSWNLRSKLVELVISAIVLAGLLSGAVAATVDAGASAPPPSVSAYLTPQGTLDYQALLRSGRDGAIDLSGYRMSFDAAGRAMVASSDPEAGKALPGDEKWWDGFGSPGVTGTVLNMAVYGGALIVGGDFMTAGGVPASRIARWDGANWSALSTGLNGTPRCLYVHDGKLIVGGWFTQAGGVEALGVAQWDGAVWSPMGSGFSGYSAVFTLVSYAGSLIAGGQFTESGGQPVSHLARWDGANWVAFGGGANANVNCLGLFGVDLVVGGGFDQIGGLSISRLARWDGTTWSAMGSWDIWGDPESLAVYQTQLYAAGWDHVKQWNGSSWVETSFPGNGNGNNLCLYDGKLVAVGWGGVRAYSWDGAAWSPLGGGLGWQTGNVAAVFNGKLHVGGNFFSVSGQNVLHIASWDGANWSGLGNSTGQGVGGVVYALAVYQGDIIAGGYFSVAGGVAVNNIARWDGASWQPLAAGVTGWENTVRALLVHNGSLVVGGAFDSAGSVWSPGLALWDGSGWSSIGRVNGGPVNAMAEFGGDLVVAGNFVEIGVIAANRVARWDGLQWSPFGTGLGGGEVRALTVFGQDLVAGGTFRLANGALGDGIVRWDGTDWGPVGTGLNGDVLALANFNGSLVAGGRFDLGNGHYNLGRWDGSTWGPLGGGSCNNEVRVLSVIDGDLYVGGWFADILGIGPIGRIARYDGYSWSGFGSSVDRAVFALTTTEDPTGTYLYVGGEITRAGDGLLSSGIARWRLGPTIRPTVLSVRDILGDQGRQVRLKWRHAEYDARYQPVSITGYALFREQALNKNDAAKSRSRSGDGDLGPANLQMEGWDYLTTVPAFGDTTYQCVLPTLCDSTATGGICWSSFIVRAVTPDPFLYYDSGVGTGYSVDNLAPSVPSGVTIVYASAGNELSWNDSAEPDFRYFKVYRGTSNGFVPDPSNLVQTTITPLWNDPLGAGPYFYKVSAVDFAGNESAPAAPSAISGVPGPGVVGRFALYPNEPNPFNPLTTIQYELPAAGHVRVGVYDLQGRLVRMLVDDERPAGRHEATWNGAGADDRQVASGLYFYRMEAGAFSDTKRMTLIK